MLLRCLRMDQMIEHNGLKVDGKGNCMCVVPQGEMRVLCSDLHVVVLDRAREVREAREL